MHSCHMHRRRGGFNHQDSKGHVLQDLPFEEGVTGRGTGLNTFTAGFEGPWTETPTTWDQDYFINLLKYDWRIVESPSGAEQYASSSRHGHGPYRPDDSMQARGGDSNVNTTST